MSKKKRNRRPNHAPAATNASQQAAGTAVAELDDLGPDEAEEAEGADQADTQALAATADAVGTSQAETVAVVPVSPVPAPPLAAAGWIPHETGDIRGVLIQIGGGRLLLPNATIAEVLSYAAPEPDESAADWLLGRFRWRGWRLPLIAFSRLAGIGEEQPGLGSKVIVLKALGGDRAIPYFAILTQGFPRLVTVARSALEVESDEGGLPEAIQARVRLNDEPALLPDLLRIERLLQEDRDAA